MNLSQSTRDLIILALNYADSQKGENLYEWIKYQSKIDKSNLSSADHQIVNGLEVGHILAAISQLSPIARSWVDYCYGSDRVNEFNRIQLGTFLFWQFRFNPDGRAYNRRLSFCKTICDDFRLRLTQDGRMLPTLVYGHAVGLKPHFSGKFPNWARDWKPYIDRGVDILQRIDAESVGEVSMTIKYLRGHQDESYSPAYRSIVDW